MANKETAGDKSAVAAKTDYSNYSKPSGWDLDAIARSGDQLSDETLAMIFDHLEPHPLSADDMAAIAHELNPEQLRSRGRPAGGLLRRRALASLVAGVDHVRFPAAIRQMLVDRLETGKRFTDNDFDRPTYRGRMRSNRHMIMRGLYGEFYELLKTGGNSITHPILGEVEIPTDWRDLTLSEKALETTAMVMRRRLGMTPPAIATMRNIVGKLNRKS